MTDDATIIFLEADDEITGVVRRVRDAGPGRVVIVAPGRSRATSSAVALRVLARAGDEDGAQLAVVGDTLTRSLAAEAGLAAYASVDDARAALPVATVEPGAQHAAIHVVRGPAADDTVATPPVAARSGADTATQAVPVARPRGRAASAARSPSARPRPRRGALTLVGVLVVAIALLGTAGLVGATLLPAATIRLVPRSDLVGPVRYEIVIEDPDRITGTVTATALVTATGTYPIQVAATGTVVFRNFNTVPVDVPAGTSVAAGDIVFTTTVAVTAPPGSLTDRGTIAGGEVPAAVVAAAIGPGGNVAAEAIDTIVDEQTRNRLRGFPQNQARLVVNPEPTAGGVDTTGVEITQADVDAATAVLRERLTAMVEERLEESDERLHADPAEPFDLVITGTDGLVGARDQPEVEISGELGYDRLLVDEGDAEARARERFAGDDDLLPAGHELLEDATRIEVGAVDRRGEELVVEVSVRGRSAPRPDRAEILDRVVGLAPEEAEAVLASIGDASVELWPGWVAEVPDNESRIDVQISGIDDPAPVPSGS